jgi:F-type H+-transporting ATPase subunit epsilon
MQLTILTPDKPVFDGTIVSVTVPGTLGAFQILKDHAPIISTLEDGKVIIQTGNEEKSIGIKGVVVEVSNNKIILLAEAIID